MPDSLTSTSGPALIVGGGVIGLSIAWLLAREGCDVVLFERKRVGRASSWAAGGMLAPDAEIAFEEPELYRLNHESLRRWPAFARTLEAETGLELDLRTEGTLTVADDRDAAEDLQRQFTFQKEQGLSVEWLSGYEARRVEPFLAPRLRAAVFSPYDYQVDNRALLKALRQAAEKHGAAVREHTPVRELRPDETAPRVITEAGEDVKGGHIVVAAGAWSRRLGGIAPELRPRVRPVRGQIIDLEMAPPFDLRHVIRGPSAYLVPKTSGRLLVGATTEEMGFQEAVTAGGLFALLDGARDLVPGVDELLVSAVRAGLRPGSRDNAPLLGPSGAPGITYATGHYRHGILLTPVTAEEITRLLLEGTLSPWLAPFLPTRFAHSHP